MYPAVSVILPTYNREHLIRRAIRSVLDQTYDNLEVIVVDDCSTDATRKVVEEFSDSRIRYLLHERRRGASAARNTGIRAALGDYIAFQDSDDEWIPDKLERQISVLEHATRRIGVVYTAFWRFRNGRKERIPKSTIRTKSGRIHAALLRRNFVTTQSALVRKECIQKTGLFDESLKRFQDWDLWIRISRVYDFAFIDVPLIKAYLQPDSITLDQKGEPHALNRILEKNMDEIRQNKRLLGLYYLRIGAAYCRLGEMHHGRIYFSMARKADRLNVLVWPLVLLSFFHKKVFSFCVPS